MYTDAKTERKGDMGRSSHESDGFELRPETPKTGQKQGPKTGVLAGTRARLNRGPYLAWRQRAEDDLDESSNSRLS